MGFMTFDKTLSKDIVGNSINKLYSARLPFLLAKNLPYTHILANIREPQMQQIIKYFGVEKGRICV